ncbi:fatty acid metabolism regulator protein [mine drainage metagenome]|uniref:Fatty acid metabolism regulator protein n=1 Tax=mine drainage metagenome TaxID=410659 RepID=A0A1J5QMH8_9ZZZZ
MDAALTIFLENGFSATRLEDIATKANVTKGTLFIYFTNKEDLFKSLIRDGMSQMTSFKEASQLNIHVSAQETLLFMTNNWWKFLANSDFGKLPKLIVSEAANFPDITKMYLEEVVEPGRALVTEVIRQGIASGEFRKVDPEQAARAFLAPLFMLLVWRYSVEPFEKHPMDELEYVNTCIKILIQGLLAHPAS